MIDSYCFSEYSSLTEMSIPSSVASIGYSFFFSKCTSLGQITIPSSNYSDELLHPHHTRIITTDEKKIFL